MNDDELATTVKEAVRGARINIPAEQIVHRGRAIRARRRIPVLVGGLTAAAAATAAAALVVASGPAAVPGQHETAGHARTVVTAAWTVREDADGTVTIYLRQYYDPAGLQQTLRADGINAIVRSVPQTTRKVGNTIYINPTCTYATTNDAPQAVQKAVWGLSLSGPFVIHPSAMPHGSALFLMFTNYGSLKIVPGMMAVDGPVVLNNDTVPACVPVPPSSK
jgi:hypothetical protein